MDPNRVAAAQTGQRTARQVRMPPGVVGDPIRMRIRTALMAARRSVSVTRPSLAAERGRGLVGLRRQELDAVRAAGLPMTPTR